MRRVTVVCTGNICRSPMAAAFLRRHLDRRGLAVVAVASAGTHAVGGREAMPEARAAAARLEADASGHLSRLLDRELVLASDLLLCAAGEHQEHVLSCWPEVDPCRVRLYNEPIAGQAPLDVDDPYGWDASVFQLAARVIDNAMQAWAERLAAGWDPERASTPRR